MEWKPLKAEGMEWLDGHFMISECGLVDKIIGSNRVPLGFTYDTKGNSYVMLAVHTMKIRKLKRIARANLVALCWLEPPKGFRRNLRSIVPTIVNLEDEDQKYHYTNLEPVYHKIKEIPTLKPERNKENEQMVIDLGDILALHKKQNRYKGDYIPYYELIGGEIISNSSGKPVRMRIASRFEKIKKEFGHKLDSEKFFIFKGLTEKERAKIRELLPYETIARHRARISKHSLYYQKGKK